MTCAAVCTLTAIRTAQDGAREKFCQDCGTVISRDEFGAEYMADIPSSLSDAYNWSSMNPERRFTSTRSEYARTLAADFQTFRGEAVKGKTLDRVDEEFSRYREGLRKRWIAAVASDSRCASWFVTGPSNFPARRMEKRSNVARARWAEVFAFRDRARAAILRTLRPDLAPIMTSDDDAAERLREKIAEAEELQRRMKEANAIIRRLSKATREEKIAALQSAIPHLTEKTAHELTLPDFAGRIGFPSWALTDNNAEIRRLKQRLEQVTTLKNTPETSREGANARLEDCPSDNRVRLFFPGKPDATTRDTLKRHGFRWAPSIGAWQAYRNDRAIRFAQEIAG